VGGSLYIKKCEEVFHVNHCLQSLMTMSFHDRRNALHRAIAFVKCRIKILLHKLNALLIDQLLLLLRFCTLLVLSFLYIELPKFLIPCIMQMGYY
jgi:hypothetical protein